MIGDPEINAMNQVYEALSGLGDKESQQRVIQWVTGRLSLSPNLPSLSKNSSSHQDVIQNHSPRSSLSKFDSIADLFSKVHLKTDVMRVLAAAAFLQEKDGKSDLASREINHELAHLGHPSTNITRDLGSLMDRKPKLVIQTRKDGKTKQAQKRYRVTSEGIRTVQDLLNKPSEEQ